MATWLKRLPVSSSVRKASEAPRAPARGISNKNAELSVALSPPSLKLRRALLAIHPRSSERGILAKESKCSE